MKFSLEVNPERSRVAMGKFAQYKRKELGFSLRDLGKLTNISHTLISNIEQAKVVASNETISEILNVLGVHYESGEEIISDFVEKYDKAFNMIYRNEFDNAKKIVNDLELNQELYGYSTVASDYFLLKYLYYTSSNTLPLREEVFMHIYISFAEIFTPKQRQLAYLVYGIHLFNQCQYAKSYTQLQKALNIGNSDLDVLVQFYILKCQCKMYLFLEAKDISGPIIKTFEQELNYSRAMEVRLTIAYAYMTVNKYDSSIELLEKVNAFARSYEVPSLLDGCNIYYLALHIKRKNYSAANEYLKDINFKDTVYYFLAIKLAFEENRKDEICGLYNEFLSYNKQHNIKKHDLIMKTVLMNMDILENDDELYISYVTELTEIGIDNYDMELVDNSYSMLIEFYKSKRMYKKALDASEKALKYRRFGCIR